MKTVSLKLAKSLKEKGYPNISRFLYWIQEPTTEPVLSVVVGNKAYALDDTGYFTTIGWKDEGYAAPTVDELLDLLPHATKDGALEIRKDPEGRYAVIYESKEGTEYAFSWGENLADLLANMWLFLKKHKLLENAE